MSDTSLRLVRIFPNPFRYMYLTVGCTVIPTFAWNRPPCQTIWTHLTSLAVDSSALERHKKVHDLERPVSSLVRPARKILKDESFAPPLRLHHLAVIQMIPPLKDSSISSKLPCVSSTRNRPNSCRNFMELTSLLMWTLMP